MNARGRPGWSILELVIVITIIGILAALALPLFNIIVRKSRFSSFASDLRTHSQAIQNYTMQAGDFPATYSTPGTFIPGLEGYLSTRWLEPTPIGGVYTWVYTQAGNPAGRGAYVQVVQTGAHPFAVNIGDIIELDRKIDDGNPATGYLQVAGNRIRYFVKLPGN